MYSVEIFVGIIICRDYGVLRASLICMGADVRWELGMGGRRHLQLDPDHRHQD